MKCSRLWHQVALLAIILRIGGMDSGGLRLYAANPSSSALDRVHEVYWWLDEIRAAAQALSVVQTGRVAQWPRMTVPAGGGVLPMPRISLPLQVDGQLTEAARQRASVFGVGPIFAGWRQGPIMLQIRAVCDEKRAAIEIESPCDLEGLQALGADGLLKVNGKAYNISQARRKPDPAEAGGSVTYSVELIVPLSKGGVDLVFRPEVIRPGSPELSYLGLDSCNGPLWLGPISVRLVSSEAAVELMPGLSSTGTPRIASSLQAAGGNPGQSSIRGDSTNGVYAYEWRGRADGREYSLSGFLYSEPIRKTLESARAILARTVEQGAVKPAGEFENSIDKLAEELYPAANADRTLRRGLFTRARQLRARIHRSMLAGPVLFTKRHPYYAGHIYDDYLTWRPGGGIYVIEDAAAGLDDRVVRAIVDPDSMETAGDGVYRDPDLSWDARRVVFAHKGKQNGDTSLYEIGVDGMGLKRLTQPSTDCTAPRPVRALGSGRHDITPAYLPDGKIVFTSTRPAGRVPCFNSEVDVLHVMNADGSNPRCLSVNNVNEFDPAILPDGRIMYGRWEYVDKTALYMQSLWTMAPDGTQETALFANNTAKPTAVLDAKPVPGSSLIVASLTPHNGQAVGAIAIIDPRLGKNDLNAVTNLTPEYPVEMDQGLRDGPCDPWPLSADDVVFANNAVGGHGILEMVDRWGNRELVHAEPGISCYSPTPIRPRRKPSVMAQTTDRKETGRFLVRDIYQGLDGVERDTVKWLRVVEETTRTSGIPGGGRWWNQAFLISWQGAYVVKNVLGVVPVHKDGSVYFEAPSGRALYFEALDGSGREIHRMRTFVQAAPGVTRSCIGCHENKMTAPMNAARPLAQRMPPARLRPEPWGSGFIDYPTMVQPVLDKHCVSCHGGEKGIAAGVDLTGGWTWAFSISYETLLKNNLVGFVRCHNSDTTSSDILKPGMIGSGAAPLTELLLDGHKGRIENLTEQQRRLIFAWMDLNSSYYGTWNWTEHATCDAVIQVGGSLREAMSEAGCTSCHSGVIGNDWVNLRNPRRSRILRAPLKKNADGGGLGWCRNRKAQKGYLPLVTQRNMPPDVFRPPSWPVRDSGGEVHASFQSPSDPNYRRMLDIIRKARISALNNARVDMPGAKINPGMCRHIIPPRAPELAPDLRADVLTDGTVKLSWKRSAEAIGLSFDIYRVREPEFKLDKAQLLDSTTMFGCQDVLAPPGRQCYALVVRSQNRRSRPTFASVVIPEMALPEPPAGLTANSLPGQIRLMWNLPETSGTRINIYRSAAGSSKLEKLNAEPLFAAEFTDVGLSADVEYRYEIRAVNRRGLESGNNPQITASALPEPREPVFIASYDNGLIAATLNNGSVKPSKKASASIDEGSLRLRAGSFLTYPYRSEFDLRARLTLECWVNLDDIEEMPVLVGCGRWNDRGWFLQKLGGNWRWHLGGVDCDGGSAVAGKWVYLVATFDGDRACLYQNGKKVADVACTPDRRPWGGDLYVGQYSGGIAPSYQVRGRIDRLTIFRRALGDGEIKERFEAGRRRLAD